VNDFCLLYLLSLHSKIYEFRIITALLIIGLGVPLPLLPSESPLFFFLFLAPLFKAALTREALDSSPILTEGESFVSLRRLF